MTEFEFGFQLCHLGVVGPRASVTALPNLRVAVHKIGTILER
jgi:hypothetical protein